MVPRDSRCWEKTGDTHALCELDLCCSFSFSYRSFWFRFCYFSDVFSFLSWPSFLDSKRVFVFLFCVFFFLCRIAAVTEQSRDLMKVIGDVGDEYRG